MLAGIIIAGFLIIIAVLLVLPIALSINVRTVSGGIDIAVRAQYIGIAVVKLMLEVAWRGSLIPGVFLTFRDKRRLVFDKQKLIDALRARNAKTRKHKKPGIPFKDILRFAKKIKVKKFHFDFSLGIKDRADWTAIASGAVAAVMNYLRIRLYKRKSGEVRVCVSPRFNKGGCSLEMLCILRVKPVHIIMVILRAKLQAKTKA